MIKAFFSSVVLFVFLLVLVDFLEYRAFLTEPSSRKVTSANI